MTSPKTQAEKLTYNEIEVGQIFSFKQSFSFEDGLAFAKLSGDFNPLHIDKEFGASSQFKQNIVHGMLASSLFSTLIGMYCPGQNSLWFSQDLNFRQPIFYNEEITARSTVMDKSEGTKLVSLKMEILKASGVAINGIARVKVIND